MASDPNITDAEYIAYARTQIDDDGDWQIDGMDAVSRNDDEGDDGAYIKVWMWVYDDDVREHAARLRERRGGGQ